MSTVEENIETVYRDIDVFNNRKTESLGEIYADTYTIHYPGLELKGIEAFSNYQHTVVNAFPDIRVKIDEIFGAGDSVAFRYTMEGTHKGEFKGIPPTGKKVKFQGVVINHFSEGKEVETWEFADRLGFLQQLGVLPPPEEIGK
ncbi:MAG: ester cyclase [Dehalococcoidales bacterium]|nr:MAG: ester cyclase [Dehalococcoidales bacterium]